jgi:GTPase SAR1 family protein
MQIETGKKQEPLKVIIYGPEGVGKSSLAAQFPKPVFVDIESGTAQLDVARTPKPSSWSMLRGIVEELTKNTQGFQTLVIDSADWADKLAIDDICAKANKAGIEDFGYGKGWQYLADEWKRMLDLLTKLQVTQNMNVVFVAHSWMRKFEQPDEAGAYDRYELKMEKKSAGILKEWACAILFCNYRTIVVDVDGKKKAQGGKRVIYSTFHPCWDAKNRHGLEDELELNIKSLAPLFASIPAPNMTTEPDSEPEQNVGARPEGIPDELWNLMTLSGITGEQIQKAVAACKYYPADMPIKDYDPTFIQGKLIASWDKVKQVAINL